MRSTFSSSPRSPKEPLWSPRKRWPPGSPWSRPMSAACRTWSTKTRTECSCRSTILRGQCKPCAGSPIRSCARQWAGSRVRSRSRASRPSAARQPTSKPIAVRCGPAHAETQRRALRGRCPQPERNSHGLQGRREEWPERAQHQEVDMTLKVHLGCGKRDFGPDWFHVDGANFPQVKHHDILDLPFAQESADLIYACHVLEYFDRFEVGGVLSTWRGFLRPGGTLRLAVLDFEVIARLYVSGAIKLEQALGPLYGRMPMN